MSDERIEVEGGKYAVLHDNGTNLRAERYGEPWRDLVGDGLVLALAQEITALRLRLASATKERDNLYSAALRYDHSTECSIHRSIDACLADGIYCSCGFEDNEVNVLRRSRDNYHAKLDSAEELLRWLAAGEVKNRGALDKIKDFLRNLGSSND